MSSGGSIQSSMRHEKSRMNKRRPLRKAKYSLVTDSEQYCEGKVKRTPGGEWNRILKPYVYKLWETKVNRVLFVERSGELCI